MLELLFEIWLCSAAIILVAHFGSALLIDGQAKLGLWAKIGLIVFSILGPLGVALELFLLWFVLADIAKEALPRKTPSRKARLLRWINIRITERRYANLHG